MQAIINSIILTNQGFSTGKTVYIENGIIQSINDSKLSGDVSVIDANGNYLMPGFIDLQIYGSGGALFSAYPTLETLQKMDADLRSKGTTSFLACLATNTPEVFNTAIEAAKAYRPMAKGFLGLQLEGPYLNPIRRGAHIEEFIRKAPINEIKDLLRRADGEIKMMTIAAELQDEEVIDYLLQQGIVLSLGHSDATFSEATTAFNAGVQTTTHLFNAMSPVHHRAPGIPTAVLNHKSAMASIIADGNHVDFEVIRMAQKLMKERLFLITDAVTACDIGPYQHRLNGDKFVTSDGTLSGSNITMLQAVRNCVQYCGIELATAINMATAYPAALIGLGNQKGKVVVGFDADLLLLDKDLHLVKVIAD